MDLPKNHLNWNITRFPQNHFPCDTAAVLLNWRRKQNIPLIIESLRKQTVYADIVLIDNATEKSCLAEEYAQDVYLYVRPEIPNRYKSSMRYLFWENIREYSYIYIPDDDVLVTQPTIERFQQHMYGGYGTLCMYGRVFHEYFTFDYVPRAPHTITSVMLSLSPLFLNMAIIPYLSIIYDKIFQDPDNTNWMEDDMILAHAVRLAGLQCGVIPQTTGDAFISRRLPSPFALCDVSNRAQKRMTAWNHIAQLCKTLRTEEC